MKHTVTLNQSPVTTTATAAILQNFLRSSKTQHRVSIKPHYHPLNGDEMQNASKIPYNVDEMLKNWLQNPWPNKMIFFTIFSKGLNKRKWVYNRIMKENFKNNVIKFKAIFKCKSSIGWGKVINERKVGGWWKVPVQFEKGRVSDGWNQSISESKNTLKLKKDFLKHGKFNCI